MYIRMLWIFVCLLLFSIPLKNILQYWGWISVIVTATAGIANGWCERILAWVRRCCLRLVDWANRRLHPSKGHTYGLSPVWMRTWVRRLKSNEKRLPHPSNGHWKAFSPVWTSWWRRSFELSTNDFWHSWQTWTPRKNEKGQHDAWLWSIYSRGPWVCKCLFIEAVSRNIFVQPDCGQRIVFGWSSVGKCARRFRCGFTRFWT